MTFDYKKEYKEFYMPKNKPGIVEIPTMNYLAVRGTGNPNEAGGSYQASIGLLYNIAFTIKMSYKGNHQIDGYFAYVVPPLEGLWQQEGIDGIDYNRKDKFHFISMIRLPGFCDKGGFRLGLSQKRLKRKSRIFTKSSFLLIMRDCVCSVCT